MTILYACMEAYAFVPQFLLQETNQHIGLFGGDVSRRMILQYFPFHAHQITAHRHLARLQVDTDAGGFEHAAPFVHVRQVIPQHRHVGDFAAGMKTFGHGNQTSVSSHAGELVHIRRIGILQQSLAA